MMGREMIGSCPPLLMVGSLELLGSVWQSVLAVFSLEIKSNLMSPPVTLEETQEVRIVLGLENRTGDST